jgi:hypothetical protein
MFFENMPHGGSGLLGMGMGFSDHEWTNLCFSCNVPSFLEIRSKWFELLGYGQVDFLD